MIQVHSIEPVFDVRSKILILGSFPSVRSRETGFYYGHPQNRFWKVLAAVFEDENLGDVPSKIAFLKRHQIALWDVVHSCEIVGSSDSSIRNVIPNDLQQLLKNTSVNQIYTNGKTADMLYRRYLQKNTGKTAICLPSTSPANASVSLNQLILTWKSFIKTEPF